MLNKCTMLVHRLRRWPNIVHVLTFAERFVFVGNAPHNHDSLACPFLKPVSPPPPADIKPVLLLAVRGF